MNEATSTLHLAKALTPDGWRRDVRLTVQAGANSRVEIGEAARDGDERHALAVAGVGNVHSHAFQRAMAGLAERRSASADNFWSWRETMYRFALEMTPDAIVTRTSTRQPSGVRAFPKWRIEGGEPLPPSRGKASLRCNDG